MAIDGLKSTYSIPGVQKEREVDPDRKKKQNNDAKKARKKERKKKVDDGRIDIRI